jgi:Carboxypeptidase regulatory-like domain/TonB dependent receptor-like, beta-barrel
MGTLKHIRKGSFLLAGLLGAVLGSLPVQGQVTTADVLGSVTDSSGAVLVGTVVTVNNVATGATRSVVADDRGDFLISALAVGHYHLKAENKGFKAYDIPDLALAEGDRRRVDIHLVVGEVTESVEVSAQATALQSDSSSLGTLINERAVQDLPLNGRNFIRLAQLSMGANEDGDNALQSGNRPDDRRSSTAVSVNGQHGYNNNFMIDGLDDNERYIGTIVVKPAMDALAEFKLITNGYAAELGRTAGGVINLITKSGTDQFHGSLFEFFRNEKMDAKNFFAGPGATPAYKQNQFGGSLGGPIKKGNTFFFGDYEGLRLRQGITFTSSVPTLAMRAGNFTGLNIINDPTTRTPYPSNQIPLSAMDPVGIKLVNLWPAPQKPGLVNNFTMSPNKMDREDKFDARVDHQFNTSNTFFGRFSFNDGNIVTPGALPAVGDIQPVGINGGFPGPALIRAENAGANYVHTFSPTFLMEQRIGYSRFANHVLPFNYGNNVMNQLGVPGINVDADSSGMSLFNVSGFQALGDSGSIPIIDYNNIYQYALTMTKVHGAHTFKWGSNLIDRRMMQFQSGSPKGSFSFDSNPTSNGAGSGGNSVASLLAGYPSSTSRSKTLYWPDFHGAEYGFYIQDDWRVSQKLTLNLGLRYDIITPLIEAHGQGCNLALGATSAAVACASGVNASKTTKSGGVPIDFNDFSPRLGFAATLTAKTVLRGGFGISFFPPVNGNSQGMRNGNYVSTLSFSTTPNSVNNRLSDGLPVPVPDNPLNPVGGTTLNVFSMQNRVPYVEQFNLTLERQLAAGLVWSVSYVGALSRKIAMVAEIDQALPGPGTIQPRRAYYPLLPGVSSIQEMYTAGTADYHSLQTSVEHRFAKGWNLISNYTYGHLIDDSPCRGGCKMGSEAGPFPVMSSNRRLDRGNSDIDLRHRWSMMVSYAPSLGSNLHGVAGVLARGWQFNAIAVMQSGQTFTIQNSSARANTGSGDRPNLVGDPYAISQSPAEWFNVSAFAAQPLYTLGNVGRNTMYGPPMKNLDFSTFKDFRLWERATLQFRAEVFNVLNHPNFGMPGSSVGASNFGVISSTANYLPRNIQLALKLLF